MPKRTLAFLFVAIALLLTTSAAEGQSRLTSFDLLRVTPSARAAALGGTFTASAPGVGPDALFYNPAFLNSGLHNQVATGYLNHLDDVWMGFAAHTRHVEQLGGTVGVAIRHLSYGSFDRTTWDGISEGSFGASETALTLSYSRPIDERLSAGASIHTAFVVLDDRAASALASDVGIVYVVPESGLELSAALRNLGVALSHIGEIDERMPLDLRLAVSKRLANLPLRLTLTGYDLTRFEQDTGTVLNEVARHLAVSGEFYLGAAFAVRLGYDRRRGEELSTGERLDLAGTSMGFGLNLQRFGFDYAYNAWSSFGGLHHLTLRASL